MPPSAIREAHMEVLSPRSANVPVKPRPNMQKPTEKARPRPEEKPANPDRIDDRWRPPVTVTEPGPSPQTYMVGRKLGKGGFAVCFEGRTQSTSEVFALKVVKAKVEQKKMMEKFRTEMQIHAKMQHPNIVEFYRAFSIEAHTYVVLEMCENGSLTDMVKARSCLSLPEVRRFMVQICGGVKYMHKRNVIHRDLKMGNIFLDASMNIKIGDFGLAAVLADEQDRRTTLCGTPNYIAPEILSKSGARGHDSKVDVWAIGIICYAMLMGTPPFQSKTQQEIYSKLKNLDYEWKVDSKNYIPEDAKDFVAACLNLVATNRPEMDDLVEYDFFKTGVIAPVLGRETMRAKPTWLLEADPRGDRVRGGVGVEHAVICAESGVGRAADGKYRPSAGEKGEVSALVEIEAENRKGCAPVTPLPEGVLYRQFTDPEPQRAAFQKSVAARPRSKKPMDEAREILSGVASRPAIVGAERLHSAARPVQSYAAQQRQQAAPARSQAPTKAPVVDELMEGEPFKPQTENKGLLRARPVRSASTRSVQAGTESNVPTRSSARLNQLDALSDQLQRDVDKISKNQEPKPVAETGTLRSRGIPRPRSVAQERKLERPISSLSNSSSDDKPRKPLRPATVNVEPKPKTTTTVSLAEVENEFAKGMILDEAPALPSRRIFKPRMVENKDTFTRVHGTSHTHIMRSLRDLHASLGSTKEKTSSSKSQLQSLQPYPRVEKWVDYATKHGIAYLLTDGSLGMILKSREEDSKASSCIVVRHAKRHTELRARGKEHQYVPQGPSVSDIEFYEQTDPTEPTRRLDVPASTFKLDLESHSSQSAAANALLSGLRGAESQRLKEVGLLDKFGKYMHKQMGSSDSSTPQQDEEAVGHLIHFYQRLGNVGAWRFADGGIQFNFPDHTKIVVYQGFDSLSEAETLVDLIYLEPRDAKDMASYGQITHEALERRDLKTFRLSDIQRQSGLRRSEMEIIRTNEIAEKLDWIRAVIGCWIKEGGLGWTGEERLGWSGLQERREDKKVKLQWVTVGRPGGDAEVAKDEKK
ncbi:Cell cycle serine/threonine-protein kinase cdc5/MSD2 [Knufia obscura]|uniref:Cell cycle serine/threonine-protein kinase cdc5/MSD2 n=2 Tax=Knufia TaxID=430999 RepID=A0AAN8EDL6_9EURO|nr:Cell cycle serine/threonine-protein kinase cdc5/MSD2 [Knufia obscura]KAK5953139.1 Cell cycle serine/threonine-protein kinase cdc5/MSD2 [Knufia fluminis]